MDGMKRLFQEASQRVRYFLARYSIDRCSENAAALTYMSLFALVPLLTVLYTMASAMPAFQGAEAQMQDFLFQHLVPESSSEIEQYLDTFAEQARNLTGPGIAFVLVTAVLMLRNIEKSFNMIWRARENRSPVASFLLYWAMLTLTPITIGLALGMSAYFNAFADTLGRFDFIGAQALLAQIAPLLLSTAGFTLIYVAVPNCRVPFGHALVGGVVAALALDIAREVFTALVVRSSISTIYGAFAAVPLFVFWIFLSWNIVLMGGILVHSFSAYQRSTQTGRPNVLKALDLLYLFWQKQQRGKPLHEKELMESTDSLLRGVDTESWSALRGIFMRHNLISENDHGQYLLARDLHTIPLWQLKEWVDEEKPPDNYRPDRELDWQTRARQLLQQHQATQRENLDIDLVALFST